MIEQKRIFSTFSMGLENVQRFSIKREGDFLFCEGVLQKTSARLGNFQLKDFSFWRCEKEENFQKKIQRLKYV